MIEFIKPSRMNPKRLRNLKAKNIQRKGLSPYHRPAMLRELKERLA